MKKLFTLLVTMVTITAMAVAQEPTLVTENWVKDAIAFSDVFKTYDDLGITLSTSGKVSSNAATYAWNGNAGGFHYISLGGSQAYNDDVNILEIKSTAGAIAKVEILWCPNGGKASNVALLGWADEASISNTGYYSMESEEYTATKSYDDAIWQTFDLSGSETDLTVVRLARQFKGLNSDGKGKVGQKNQTINVFGIKVTLANTTPATEPTLRNFVMAGVDVTVDHEAHTIAAELPFGTDRDAAIEAATVTIGGSATGYTYNADKTELTITDGTNNLVYTLNITVSTVDPNNVCGVLIKATHVNKNTATLSGVWAADASADKNTQDSGKLGSNGHYFGIVLNGGRTFQAGDVLNVNIDAASVSARLDVYTDKSADAKIFTSTDIFTPAEGDNFITLPAAAQGATKLYLYREDSGMNPAVAFLEVTRDCDAKLLGFVIAGVTAVIDEEAHTITAELPAGTQLTAEDWANAYTVNSRVETVEYNAEHTTLTINGEVVYTLNITIAETLSDDATLATLKVNNADVAGFAADVLAYNVVLPYGTTALPVVTAEANHVAAEVAITNVETIPATFQEEATVASVVVTAQDGTQLTYTISFTVAAAPISIHQILMSNGFDAWMPEGGNTIVAYYLGETQPTVATVEASEGVTFAVEGNTVTFTGVDGGTLVKSLDLHQAQPLKAENQELTFDGTETWIAGGYGYDATKGWKFSKTDNDYSREIAGKTRIYFYVEDCDTLVLNSGDVSARDIKVFVDDIELAAPTKTVKNGSIKIAVEKAGVAIVRIESNQTGGDGGFSGAVFVEAVEVVIPDPVYPTGVVLNETAKTLEIGETVALTATLAPANVDADKTAIVWTSSNEAVATVAEGVVTAIAAGEATITATTVNGLTATCAITVNAAVVVPDPVYPTGITLNETAKTLEIGETVNLTATLAPANVDEDKTAVVWTSSNEAVATVAEGVVTAIAAGEAVITATTVNGLTATCTVTVNAKQEPEGLNTIAIDGIYYANGVIYNPMAVNMQVYNAVGQLVATGNSDIELNDEKAGLYIICTANGTLKVVK